MNNAANEPHLTSDGIVFTVTVDSEKRECLIKEEALEQLGAMKNAAGVSSGMMEVYRAFESKINGVARRLVAAGVQGKPLVLTRNTFAGPPRRA